MSDGSCPQALTCESWMGNTKDLGEKSLPQIKIRISTIPAVTPQTPSVIHVAKSHNNKNYK